MSATADNDNDDDDEDNNDDDFRLCLVWPHCLKWSSSKHQKYERL